MIIMRKKITVFLFEFASTCVSAIAIIALIFIIGIRVTTVNGSSMEPTLSDSDKLVIICSEQKFEYKDIVIICEPNILDEIIVKRVIATEGQWVDVRYNEGLVYVGDSPDTMQPLDEDYTACLTDEFNPEDRHEYPVQVPENCIFAMGDNRNDSTDSRSFRVGFVQEGYILGKVLFRFAPSFDFSLYD